MLGKNYHITSKLLAWTDENVYEQKSLACLIIMDQVTVNGIIEKVLSTESNNLP